MLTIPLIEPIPNYIKPLYYKDFFRYPSVTDINFISNEYVIVIHRYSAKVYLIKLEYDENDKNKIINYNIIDTLKIKYGNNEQVKTEMLTRINNRLFIITFTDDLVIVDIINNTTLSQIKAIKLVNGSNYHGIKYHKDYIYIVPSIVNKKNSYLHILKLCPITLKKQLIITDEFKKNTGLWRLKNIAFLPNNNILLAIIINNGITSMFNKNHSDKGYLALYSPNYKLLNNKTPKCIHIDGLITKDYTYYMTVRDDRGAFIEIGNIDLQNNINLLKEIKVPDFCHGLDIHNKLFGFTSYKTNSAYILELKDLDDLDEIT
jgi:hypothetical protein